jgi:hypothetical protein
MFNVLGRLGIPAEVLVHSACEHLLSLGFLRV